MARKPPLVDLDDSKLRGATRASAVYERLRSDIAHGILEPGFKLRIESICERYGVGASPLREAMNRLSAEGLITRTDQRGFSVAPVNWSELTILTRNRVQLESLALSESIENRDQEWENRLALLVHQLSRTPRSLESDRYVPNPEWETLHKEFHRALLANCNSRWLKSFCDNLSDEAYRFRQLAAVKVFSSRNEHAEHEAIFDAAIHGRTDLAVRLITEHYVRTSSVVSTRARELGRVA